MAENTLKFIIETTLKGSGFKDAAGDLGALKIGAGAGAAAMALIKSRSSDASGALKAFGVDLKGIEDAFKDPLTAIATGLKASIDLTVQWGGTIDELSRITGQSAEETSKLAVVMEDIGVSTDTLKAASKSLKEQGLVPTLDTIKKLAAEYQAIEDPVERNKWGAKNLGKAYFDLSEALTKTPEELDALGAAAERSGRIMSQDAVDAAEKYEQSLAQLNDMIQGVMVKTGGGVIPTVLAAGEALSNEAKIAALVAIEFQRMTQIIDYNEASQRAAAVAAGDLSAALKEQYVVEGDVTDAHDRAAAAARQVSEASLQTTANYEAFDVAAYGASRAAYEVAQAERDAATAAADLKTKQSDFAAILAGPVKAEQDAYYQRQKDAGAAIADTQAKIDELNAKSYLTPAQRAELDGLNQTLKDQKQVYADNATAHEEATKRILFGFLEQRLAADGLTSDELKFLGTVGTAWGVLDQQTGTMLGNLDSALATSKGNAQDFLTTIGGVYALKDKDININIHVNGQIPDAGVNDPDAAVNYGPDAGGTNSSGNAYASGVQNMVVPPGYPNDSYPMRVQSGEVVDVWRSPGERAAAMGGGRVNIVNNIYDQRAMAMELERQRRLMIAQADALMG